MYKVESTAKASIFHKKMFFEVDPKFFEMDPKFLKWTLILETDPKFLKQTHKF